MLEQEKSNSKNQTDRIKTPEASVEEQKIYETEKLEMSADIKQSTRIDLENPETDLEESNINIIPLDPRAP